MTRLEATKYSSYAHNVDLRYNTTAKVLQYSFWLAGEAVGQWKVDQHSPNKHLVSISHSVCVCMTSQLFSTLQANSGFDLIPSDHQLSSSLPSNVSL